MNYKVPKQYKGNQSDTYVERIFEDSALAKKEYMHIKKKFFDINSWYFESGKKMSEFNICDNTGDNSCSEPRIGNYIRINVDGLKNADGKGYDWVQITVVMDEESQDLSYCVIEVKPCCAPGASKDEVAHFYNKDASNSFILKQSGNKITLEIFGRNETINEEGSTILAKIRNWIMAVGGLSGGSKMQWDLLAKNLIN